MNNDSTAACGPADDWLRQGNTHMERRLYARARRSYETAARLARTAGDRDTLTLALVNLGTACLKEGRLVEARRHFETALPLAQELDQTLTRTWIAIAVIRHGLADISHVEGRLEEAQRHIDQAVAIRLQLMQQLGVEMLPFTVASTALLACIHEARGRLEDAHDYFDRAVSGRRTLAALHPEIHGMELAATLLKLAGVCTKLGRHEEARRHAGEARAVEQRVSQGFTTTTH